MGNYLITKPINIHEYRTNTFIDEVKDKDIIELTIKKTIDNKVEIIYEFTELNNIKFELGSKKGEYMEVKKDFSSQIQNIVSDENLNKIEIYISGYPSTPFIIEKKHINP